MSLQGRRRADNVILRRGGSIDAKILLYTPKQIFYSMLRLRRKRREFVSFETSTTLWKRIRKTTTLLYLTNRDGSDIKMHKSENNRSDQNVVNKSKQMRRTLFGKHDTELINRPHTKNQSIAINRKQENAGSIRSTRMLSSVERMYQKRRP